MGRVELTKTAPDEDPKLHKKIYGSRTTVYLIIPYLKVLWPRSQAARGNSMIMLTEVLGRD
jgi:hypothetical protein